MVTYSLIIPAYNEAAFLPATLAAAHAAMAEVPAPGELIVVDNNSNDGTGSCAAAAGARVVFEPVNQIARARNAGARAAAGQYLLFLDADTHLPPALLRAAVANLAAGDCYGGGARLTFDAPLPWAARLFARAWERHSQRLGLAAGCFVYCLREGFAAVGGFDESVYASEEVWFCRRLRAWGRPRGLCFRTVPEPPVCTSARKFAWFPRRRLWLLVLLTLIPFALRSRRLCALWYTRPPPR